MQFELDVRVLYMLTQIQKARNQSHELDTGCQPDELRDEQIEVLRFAVGLSGCVDVSAGEDERAIISGDHISGQGLSFRWPERSLPENITARTDPQERCVRNRGAAKVTYQNCFAVRCAFERAA